MLDNAHTKTCSKCKECLSIECFGNARNTKDRKQNYCKPCMRAYNSAYGKTRHREDPVFRERKRSANKIRYKDPRVRERHLIKCREWRSDPVNRENKREKEKERVLRNGLAMYGVSREDYEAMVKLGCAICGGPPNGGGRYHLDHNHDNGKFRGLLCALHNAALGLFDEDPELLEKAATYIRKHR